MQLGEFVPTTANLQYHAQIVREKAILRRFDRGRVAHRRDGLRRGRRSDMVVDMAERTIFESPANGPRRVSCRSPAPQ
jgi:replicative DNA helicase